MKRLTLLLSLAICLTVTASPQSQLRIDVEARASSRIPVKVESASGVIDNDQTALRYKLTNRSGRRLTALGMIALVVGRDGEVKGGEGWKVNQTLAANSTEEFLRVMSTKLESGDRLILTAWRASDDSGTFELDKTELDSVFTSYAGRVKPALRVTRVNAVVQDTAQYCRGWYEYAKSNCSCGVKTFSCNPRDGSFSWTSFAKQEAPDCEGEGLGPDQPTNPE